MGARIVGTELDVRVKMDILFLPIHFHGCQGQRSRSPGPNIPKIDYLMSQEPIVVSRCDRWRWEAHWKGLFESNMTHDVIFLQKNEVRVHRLSSNVAFLSKNAFTGDPSATSQYIWKLKPILSSYTSFDLKRLKVEVTVPIFVENILNDHNLGNCERNLMWFWFFIQQPYGFIQKKMQFSAKCLMQLHVIGSWSLPPVIAWLLVVSITYWLISYLRYSKKKKKTSFVFRSLVPRLSEPHAGC